jgi:hypothetical protein
MEIKRTYTALKIKEKQKEISSFSYELKMNLIFGNTSSISGGIINTEFVTEDEAIQYAFEQDRHADWLILPKISFIAN